MQLGTNSYFYWEPDPILSIAIILTRSIGPRREALAPVSFVPEERGGLLAREPEAGERRDVRRLEPVRSSIRVNGPPTGILGSSLSIDAIMHRSPSHKSIIRARNSIDRAADLGRIRRQRRHALIPPIRCAIGAGVYAAYPKQIDIRPSGLAQRQPHATCWRPQQTLLHEVRSANKQGCKSFYFA
jgi:hypothetical protein